MFTRWRNLTQALQPLTKLDTLDLAVEVCVWGGGTGDCGGPTCGVGVAIVILIH